MSRATAPTAPSGTPAAQMPPSALFFDARVMLCMVAMVGLFVVQQLMPGWLRRRAEAMEDERSKKRS